MSSAQPQNPFARTSQKTNTLSSLIPGGASAGNKPFSPSKSLIPGGGSAGNSLFSPSKSLIYGNVSAGNNALTTSKPLNPSDASVGNNPFSPSKVLIPGGTPVGKNTSKPLGELKMNPSISSTSSISFISNVEPEVPRTFPAEFETSPVLQSAKVTDIFKTKHDVSLDENVVHQEIKLQAKSQKDTEILNALKDCSNKLQSNFNNITNLITVNDDAIASRLEQIEQTVSLLNNNINNITKQQFEQMNTYEKKLEENVNQISLQTQKTINSSMQNFNTKWEDKTDKFITEEDLRAMLDTVINKLKAEVATMIDNRLAHLAEKSLSPQVPTASLQSPDE